MTPPHKSPSVSGSQMIVDRNDHTMYTVITIQLGSVFKITTSIVKACEKFKIEMNHIIMSELTRVKVYEIVKTENS